MELNKEKENTIKSSKSRQSNKPKSIITYVLTALLILTVFSVIRSYSLRVIVTIVSIMPSYLFAKYSTDYFSSYLSTSNTSIKKIFFNMLGCFLLSVFIYLSFYHKFKGSGKLSIVSNFGIISISAFMLFLLKEKFLNIRIKSISKTSPLTKKQRIIIFSFASLFPLSIGTIVLLGFFPGSMNIDYFVIYGCITDSMYMDAHPIMYTMLIRILTFIYDSPASLSIFHILLSSFTYTYIAYRLNKMGMNIVYSCLLIVLLTLTPANIFINAVLWKDVVYTMFLLLLSIEILRMFTEKDYFDNFKNIILMFVFGYFVLVARHNGQYVMILLTILVSSYFAVSKHWKYMLRFTLTMLAIVFAFYTSKFIVIHSLGDNYYEHEYTSNVLYSVPAQGMLVTYIDENDNLSTEDKASIEHYINIDKALKRNHDIDAQGWDFEMWKFKNDGTPFINLDNIESDKSGFFNLYFNLAKSYPDTVFEAYMKNTALAWSSLNYGYTYAFELGINEPFIETSLKFEDNIILKNINSFMYKAENFIQHNDLAMALFFRPAFAFILVIFLILASKNMRNSYLLSLPVLLNHLGYFIGCSAQDTRYMYGNYSLFIILLFYVLLTNTISLDKPKANI